MKNANILNEIMGNELVKALLEQASPEEREEGMKMIKDITSTVQKQVSEMMTAMNNIDPTQLEKLLREQT